MAAKSERAKANARASSREYMRRKRAAGYKEPPLTPEQKEKRKAVYRRHHAKNAEKRRAYSRQWKKEHPEQVKANKRKSWAKVSQDPEVRAKARAANRRFVHGPNFDAMWAGMWDAQKGLCYLCEEPLVPGFDTHIDHDHSCCPKGRTCLVPPPRVRPHPVQQTNRAREGQSRVAAEIAGTRSPPSPASALRSPPSSSRTPSGPRLAKRWVPWRCFMASQTGLSRALPGHHAARAPPGAACATFAS